MVVGREKVDEVYTVDRRSLKVRFICKVNELSENERVWVCVRNSLFKFEAKGDSGIPASWYKQSIENELDEMKRSLRKK